VGQASLAPIPDLHPARMQTNPATRRSPLRAAPSIRYWCKSRKTKHASPAMKKQQCDGRRNSERCGLPAAAA